MSLPSNLHLGTSGIIAVHVGAGYHSPAKMAVYRSLCAAACHEAASQLREGGSSLDGVTAATAILENSGATNAGFGSNLTYGGQVECDAGVMEGGSTPTFGAVGAVPGVKNPVCVAARLLAEQKLGPLSHGRVRPCFLAGDGARSWAEGRGMSTCGEELVSKESRRHWKKFRELVRSEDEEGEEDDSEELQDEEAATKKKRKLETECEGSGEILLDTVGAVCVDSRGVMAAACSSGGLQLKTNGRVGQAAVFGCGCWAENGNGASSDGVESGGVAVSASGCGEHLIASMLCRECGHALLQDGNLPAAATVRRAMCKCFLESPQLPGPGDERMAGLLVLSVPADTPRCVELLIAHTTPSMCVGYSEIHSTTSPKFWESRLPRSDGARDTGRLEIRGKTIVLPVRPKTIVKNSATSTR